MSSSQARGGERLIHQDFIARIRYSNALPPPPNPPKLLDIPNTGLSSGQYTNPGFASRLAREQPLNVEADAELGMPLDLVGMPGIFDGDESSIQAPAHPPAVHPHDRPLLRPLASLGRPKVAESSVSFLRRTEYISSLSNRRHDSGSRVLLNKPQQRQKRPAPEPAADSPAAIKRKIDRSFEVAELSLRSHRDVRHPTSRSARVVSASPFLPDLDAFPDSGAYVAVKFANNPVAKSHAFDARLLAGIFRPIEKSAAEEEAYEAALAAHQHDPERVPRPQNTMNYDLYLPETASVAEAFRARFDPSDPRRDDDSLYGTRGRLPFARLRAYETEKEREYEHREKYDSEILVAFAADGAAGSKATAAYYYPVMQVSQIRPRRARNIARTIGALAADDDERAVDQLDVAVEDPIDEVREAIRRFREQPYGPDAEEQEQEQLAGGDDDAADADAEAEGDADADAEPAENGGGRGGRGGGRGRAADDESATPSDQDAEGDEDDD